MDITGSEEGDEHALAGSFMLHQYLAVATIEAWWGAEKQALQNNGIRPNRVMVSFGLDESSDDDHADDINASKESTPTESEQCFDTQQLTTECSTSDLGTSQQMDTKGTGSGSIELTSTFTGNPLLDANNTSSINLLEAKSAGEAKLPEPSSARAAQLLTQQAAAHSSHSKSTRRTRSHRAMGRAITSLRLVNAEQTGPAILPTPGNAPAASSIAILSPRNACEVPASAIRKTLTLVRKPVDAGGSEANKV
jgi:hypothetical protein